MVSCQLDVHFIMVSVLNCTVPTWVRLETRFLRNSFSVRFKITMAISGTCVLFWRLKWSRHYCSLSSKVQKEARNPSCPCSLLLRTYIAGLCWPRAACPPPVRCLALAAHEQLLHGGGSSHGPFRGLSFHRFIWAVRLRGVLSFLASLDFSTHFCASGGFVSDSCSDLDFWLSPSRLSLSKVFAYSSKL